MKKNLLILIAICGAMALTACQKEEDLMPEEKPEEPGTEQVEPTWTLTLEAGKAASPDTKALELSGDEKTLNAVWASGETVSVYSSAGELLGTLDVTPKEDATKATLSGTLTGTLSEGQSLTLLFPQSTWNYSAQNGKLTGEGSIEKLFDYATAGVTVNSIDGSNLLVDGPATFANQQSIYRFGFKYNSAAINVKKAILSSDKGKLVGAFDFLTPANSTYGSITLTLPSATTDLVYAAIKNENTTEDDTFSFTVYDGDGITYQGDKVIPVAALSRSFVSAKNVPLSRLDLEQSATTVSEVL